MVILLRFLEFMGIIYLFLCYYYSYLWLRGSGYNEYGGIIGKIVLWIFSPIIISVVLLVLLVFVIS